VNRDTRSVILSQTAAFAVCFLVLLFILIVINPDTDVLGDPTWTPTIMLVFFMIALLLHVFIHELGHVLFGKMSGYTLMAVSVLGFWSLRTDEGKKRIYMPIQGAMGGTISLPKDGYRNDTPYKMMIMGGVFMNVLLTVICFIVLLTDVNALVNLTMTAAVVAGLFAITTNAIPVTMGFVVNDAMLLRMFNESDASKHCAYYAHMRTFAVLKGSDPGEIRVPCELPYGNRLADTVRFFLAENAVMKKDYETAETGFADLLNNTEDGNVVSKLTKMYLILIRLIGNADREIVDSLYDKKMKKFVKAFAQTAHTALLLLVAYEKRFSAGENDVDKLVKRFNKIVGKLKIDTSFERDVMDSLLAGDNENAE